MEIWREDESREKQGKFVWVWKELTLSGIFLFIFLIKIPWFLLNFFLPPSIGQPKFLLLFIQNQSTLHNFLLHTLRFCKYMSKWIVKCYNVNKRWNLHLVLSIPSESNIVINEIIRKADHSILNMGCLKPVFLFS